MKPMPTPRRLLQLDALFSRGPRWGGGLREEPVFEDTRMPDDIDVLALQRLASTQLGRIAAEVALEEGGRRLYAPREESEVLEQRRERAARD